MTYDNISPTPAPLGDFDAPADAERIESLIASRDDALDTIDALRARVAELEAEKKVAYTNGLQRTPAQIAKDIELILDWATDHPSKFECDCDAYQESDTGAWIHEEDKCSAYIEDHLDIVLRSLVAHFKGKPVIDTRTVLDGGDLEF